MSYRQGHAGPLGRWTKEPLTREGWPDRHMRSTETTWSWTDIKQQFRFCPTNLFPWHAAQLVNEGVCVYAFPLWKLLQPISEIPCREKKDTGKKKIPAVKYLFFSRIFFFRIKNFPLYQLSSQEHTCKKFNRIKHPDFYRASLGNIVMPGCGISKQKIRNPPRRNWWLKQLS